MSSPIDQVLRAAVESGDVPCAIAMAADRVGILYEGAAGRRAPGSDEPVTPDTVLRIASMTKMVTTVAALQQVERGNLDLDAPVETYRPEFADVQVLDGFDGDTPRLRAPRSRATVGQLLTHTAGLGYWFLNADIVRWEAATGTPNLLSGSDVVFTAPMVADPGTKFEYGINTDWLGKVVEEAAGRSLDTYLEENILGPLAMNQTGFTLSAEQRARCLPVHVRGEDGSWVATDVDWPPAPDFWAGGHGLYSTPRDYLAFQRMLLAGGALGEAKILEPATVEAAFTNQIGALDFPAEIRSADPSLTADVSLGPGFKWGYGLLLSTAAMPGLRAPGTGSWAGLFNSHFFVDRATGVTGAVYTQTLPFLEPAAFLMAVRFEMALYASL